MFEVQSEEPQKQRINARVQEAVPCYYRELYCKIPLTNEPHSSKSCFQFLIPPDSYEEAFHKLTVEQKPFTFQPTFIYSHFTPNVLLPVMFFRRNSSYFFFLFLLFHFAYRCKQEPLSRFVLLS